jgi:hypothetical protein
MKWGSLGFSTIGVFPIGQCPALTRGREAVMPPSPSG